MRRLSWVLLGSVVTACAVGDEGPAPPPVEYPLDVEQPEAQLPRDLVGLPEEKVDAHVVEDADPVAEARSVRYFPDTGTVLALDDEVGESPAPPAGDLTLPGTRGLYLVDEGVSQRVIFGSDGRRLVSNTLDWPARAFVKIYIRWPNGAGASCSGTLIGRKSVITAGHCIYNPDRGGWAASTRVVPGLDGTYMPFGSAYQVYYDTVKGWTEDQNNDYDYAMITLDRNLGDATGWLGIASLSNSTLDGLPAAIQGYPGDLSGGTRQYVDTDPIQDFDSTMLYYDIDTMPGDSGASVHPTGTYHDYVIGVHGGSSYYWLQHYNRAARINSTRFDKILGWISNRAGLPTVSGNFNGWSSIGGKTYTSPSLVTIGNGRFDAFVRGTNGAVYTKAHTASGWSPSTTGWTHIGGAITDSVAAVSRRDNQIDLFVRGTDGAVWTKARYGTTWWPAGSGWARLGGSITGTPAAVSYGANRLDVFARGASGNVIWLRWAGSTWSAPVSLGGAITGQPTAVSWGPSRIDLFARATNGNLVHRWYNGSYWNSAWENLGGYIDTSPVALAPQAYVLEIFARGGDQALWHRRYQSGWHPWESLGGQITDEVGAVSRYSGQFDLFVRGTSGAIYTKAHNGSTWWPSTTGWAYLGGDMLGVPAVVSTASNRLDVVARGYENGLRIRSWNGSSW